MARTGIPFVSVSPRGLGPPDTIQRRAARGEHGIGRSPSSFEARWAIALDDAQRVIGSRRVLFMGVAKFGAVAEALNRGSRSLTLRSPSSPCNAWPRPDAVG